MGYCDSGCEHLTSRHNCKKYKKGLAYSSYNSPSIGYSSHERCSECDKDYYIKELEEQIKKSEEREYKIGDRFITDYGEPSTLTQIQEDKEGVCYFLTDDTTPYISDSYGELDLDEFKRIN